MSRQWKPGDVARLANHGGVNAVRTPKDCGVVHHDYAKGDHWHYLVAIGQATWDSNGDCPANPLVVIDPEDREQVARLSSLIAAAECGDGMSQRDAVGAALHSLIAPPKPDEPTDPKARVEDARENIWRLLADGEWVCTSGPDIGEYVTWDELVKRGPLGVTQP